MHFPQQSCGRERIITALYKRTESGINGGTGRAPLRASGQPAWIRNLMSLSQNALIPVTARAVNVCRTWTSGKRNKGAQRDQQGTCKGTRGHHKGHQRDHFDLQPPPHSIFGQASEAVSAHIFARALHGELSDRIGLVIVAVPGLLADSSPQ